MNLSRSRRKLLDRLRQLAALTEVALARSPLFPASLYRLKSRCGKPQCKCAKSAYRHEQWCISFLEGGASRTRTVPPELRAEIRKMTEEYRQFRQAERGLRRALDALITEMERMREARCEAGRRRYERMVRQRQEAQGVRSPPEGG